MNCSASEIRTGFTLAAVALVGRLPWQPYLLAINHLPQSDWNAVPINTASHSAARLDFGSTSHDCCGLNSSVHVAEALTALTAIWRRQRYDGIYIRNTVTSKVNPEICMDFLFRQLCQYITNVLCWLEQFSTIQADRVMGLMDMWWKKHDLISTVLQLRARPVPWIDMKRGPLIH